MSITTDAGQAIAAGIAFSLSDGKLPKGIKQVHCNIDGTYRVFSMAVQPLVTHRTSTDRTEAFSAVKNAYSSRRRSVSSTQGAS